MTGSIAIPLSEPVRRFDWHRFRLVAWVALYGGALGASQLVVALLTRIPFWVTPERLDLVPSVFLSSAGMAAGVLVAGLLTYIASGGDDIASGRDDQGRAPWVWLALGIIYGVAVPFVTGIFMPVSILLLDLTNGVITLGEFLPDLRSYLFRLPAFIIYHGAFALLTGFLAWPIFSVGAWLIDYFNASSDPRISRYVSFAISIALSVGVVAFVVLVPPHALARLG